MPRRGHDSTDYLFHTHDFHAVQDTYHERLTRIVDDADAASIQDGTIDDAATRFADGLRLEVPELTEGAISVDIEEARVDVTGDFHYAAYGPGPHLVPGIRASYFVPFVGDREMFKVKPTTWTTVIPAAASWLRQHVTAFNDSLSPLALQHVTARRARLTELQKGTSSLGIQIRRAAPPASSPPAGLSTKTQGTRTPSSPSPRRYDIALSFAGEDRAFVQEVAKGLRESRRRRVL